MAISYLNPGERKSLNQKFREKRFRHFLDQFNKLDSDKTIRILDIGGTENYWEKMDFTEKENVHITLLNLKPAKTNLKNFSAVQGDARDLSDYKDNEFDIVFSNSVIEHLFTFENQHKMATEIQRV